MGSRNGGEVIDATSLVRVASEQDAKRIVHAAHERRLNFRALDGRILAIEAIVDPSRVGKLTAGLGAA